MSAARPHAVRWERFVYGKLIQHPNGPIVPGSDHAPTGRSAGFPDDLASFCHPSTLGLGDRDGRLWSKYPWPSTGGIVSGYGLARGERWILVGRSRQRAEAGEGQPGRLYTESHYAGAPACSYGFWSLRELARRLHADPLTAINTDLEPFEIPAEPENRELPSDWLRRIEAILVGVMSGIPVSIQDWETEPEAFLSTAEICLAAIPSSLAASLPVGAGLLTMDGTKAFATGMMAVSGLRIIGGTPKNSDEFDLRPGQAYVDWLGKRVQGSIGILELADIVDHELPGEFSAPPGEKSDWAGTATTVSRIVQERRRLVAILERFDIAGELPEHLDFVYLRKPLLEAFAERLRGPRASEAAEVLAGTATNGWTDDWWAIASADSGEARGQERALAMLYGMAPISNSELLLPAASIALTSALAESVGRRLAQAMQESSSGEMWLALYEGASEETGWVRNWRHAASPRLVWLGVRDALAPGRSTKLLKAMRSYPPAATALALLGGETPEDGPLRELMASAILGDAALVDFLVRSISAASMWSALRAAEAAEAVGVPVAFVAALTRGAGRNESPEAPVDVVAVRLVEEVRVGKLPISKSMTRLLLSAWETLRNGPDAAFVTNLLAERIGEPYATALLGRSFGDIAGPDADVAHPYCLSVIGSQPWIAERLIGMLEKGSADIQQRAISVLVAWLGGYGIADGQECPLATMVLSLAGRTNAVPPRLGPEDRRQVCGAVMRLGMSPQAMLPYADSESALDVVATLWPGGRRLVLDVRQIRVLVECTLFDPTARARWDAQIDRRRWGEDIGWRWIARRATNCTKIEEEAAGGFSGRAILELWLLGLPVPSSTAARVRPRDIEECIGNPQQGQLEDAAYRAAALDRVARIFSFVKKSSMRELLTPVAIWLFMAARIAGYRREEVVATLSKSRPWLGLIPRGHKEDRLIEMLRSALHGFDPKEVEDFARQHWPSGPIPPHWE